MKQKLRGWGGIQNEYYLKAIKHSFTVLPRNDLIQQVKSSSIQKEFFPYVKLKVKITTTTL